MAVSVEISGGGKWRAVLEKYLKLGEGHVKVGVFSESSYPGDAGANVAGMPVAAIAAFHEFGTTNIPARSFMRSTVAEKSEEWAAVAAAYLQAQPDKAEGALAFIGEAASKDMQKKIEDFIPPPLAVSTIIRKAIRKGREGNNALPLVDTGTLQEAINYEVVGGGDE